MLIILKHFGSILLFMGSIMVSQSLPKLAKENGKSSSIFDLQISTSLEQNAFAATWVSGLVLWALLWMKLDTGSRFAGPKTPSGHCPTYNDNGKKYFFVSLGLLGFLLWKSPNISIQVYNAMPNIIAILNIVAVSLCIYLVRIGKTQPAAQHSSCYTKTEHSLAYQFFLGTVKHQNIFGNKVDVKQLSIIRVGMMGWLLFTLIFLHAGWQIVGKLDPGHLTHVLLQVTFICRAFLMERGFATLLEAKNDKAGYYVCWGGIVWQPVFYSWQSYFLVDKITNVSWEYSVVILLFGWIMIYCNHQVAVQKARAKTNNLFNIWGKPARLMHMKSEEGDSCFLVSGWWGIGRKMNYLFEILIALAWTMPGYSLGYKNFIFLGVYVPFFVHRVFRDEKICSKRYGVYWGNYCKLVPYRMIPYIF